ncbi:Suppressor of the cold-sensitive snRNP bioproteinsis mutant brr1-1 [Perkinsus chesapeaki]|uniref:subtilisin n=1 Tax=Perkinsus chesapeaki TaxID=330153 RepID=A0A7J6MKD6_PERCH|nr:Suppressor of the cold-sensitive snRNP bioproteinsis mutant brr1-1 [Perkinsus chesapeaki]
MQSLLPTLLIWFAIGQTTRGQRTILSVLSNDSMIDVRHIPQRLSLAGIPTSPKSDKVVAFLSAASIETLRFAGCQIAPTSVSTVRSDELCDYLHLASHHMPHLSVACGEDAEVVELVNRERQHSNQPTTTSTAQPTTPRSTTTTTSQPPRPALDGELHVNDAHVRFQKHLARMKMGDVWDLVKQYPRRNVTVAVIDEGVDFTDPDLAHLRSTFTRSDGRVIDGGWNFVDNSSSLALDDYHGQYISRIIGAQANNSYGIVGVAPDHVRLVSLQASGINNTGTVIDVIEALDTAMDIGVDVVSLSMGFQFTNDSVISTVFLTFALRRAEDRGIIVVSAAGNDNTDAERDEAAYNLSDYSNYGNRVDLAAFGDNIYAGPNAVGKHYLVSGTSFAAPMVTGAAAILLSMGAERSVVKRLLLEGADHFDSPGRPLNQAGGALNILESVKRVIGMYSLRPINEQALNLRGRV